MINSKQIFIDALKNNYAIGAFNFSNLESLQAIVESANENNSPVIVATSSSAIKYMGYDYLINIVNASINNSKVPVVLHLDHGKDFETCKEAIDHGYKSVMIDASHLSFEDNIKVTKQVVDYAHLFGVTVEGELGVLMGVEDEVSSDKEVYTNPASAKEFVERTGVDSLAVAIGTSHGAFKFKGEPKLRFDILEEIEKLLPNFPLVLHGASSVSQKYVDIINNCGGEVKDTKGVPEEILKQACKHNICKINMDTDLRMAFTAGVKKCLYENKDLFDFRKYLNEGKNLIKEVVTHKIVDVLGSNNRVNY